VLLVDDVLATGGTAAAAIELIEQLGGRVIGAAFVVELGFLDGRSRLAHRTVHSLVRFDTA
jgi:adenine phosphoribosyltransferase